MEFSTILHNRNCILLSINLKFIDDFTFKNSIVLCIYDMLLLKLYLMTKCKRPRIKCFGRSVCLGMYACTHVSISRPLTREGSHAENKASHGRK